MKTKIAFVLFSALTLFVTVSCISKAKKEEAKVFLEEVSEIRDPIIDSNNSILYNSYDIVNDLNNGLNVDEEINTLDIELDEFIVQVDAAIKTMNSLDEFDEKHNLKNQTILYLESTKKTVDKDFRKLVALFRYEYSEKNRIEMGEIITNIGLSMVRSEKAMEEVFVKYAEKYSIDYKLSGHNWEKEEKQLLEQLKYIEEWKEQVENYTNDEVIYD